MAQYETYEHKDGDIEMNTSGWWANIHLHKPDCIGFNEERHTAVVSVFYFPEFSIMVCHGSTKETEFPSLKDE